MGQWQPLHNQVTYFEWSLKILSFKVYSQYIFLPQVNVLRVYIPNNDTEMECFIPMVK